MWSDFFKGTWNFFHRVEAGLVGLFWILVIFTIRKRRLLWPIVFLFAMLALANIRVNAPGEIYYAAFHHLQYWGVLIMAVLLLIKLASGTLAKLATVGFIGISLFAMLSPQSYLH